LGDIFLSHFFGLRRQSEAATALFPTWCDSLLDAKTCVRPRFRRMLDRGKTPLKVVHTKPAVCLLAAKMAALQLLLRAA
jgi:hypothetical protein